MAHLGILLVCEHYPALAPEPRSLDGQLRHWLSVLGHDVTRTSAFACHEGRMPRSAGAADLWIVSGQPLGWSPCCRDLAGRLMNFLRAAAAGERPILAVHHGEHLVHAALSEPGAPPPDSRATVRSIRNPFRSFHSRDRLFAFDPATRRVLEAERPAELSLAHCFGRAWHVA